jgi:hypothetical protein
MSLEQKLGGVGLIYTYIYILGIASQFVESIEEEMNIASRRVERLPQLSKAPLSS